MEQTNPQSQELAEQCLGQESSHSASESETCTDKPSPEQAEAIIQWAAVQARRNAQTHEAQGTARIGPILAKDGIQDRIAAFRARLRDPQNDQRAREADENQARRDRAARIERLVASSGVPPKYVSAWPDSALDLVPRDVAEMYAVKFQALMKLARQPVVVGLIGSVGPGKTWMACAVVNAFCRAGKSAEYHEVSDYFIDVKETFGNDAHRRQSEVEKTWFAPQLLIVDEMQERGDTPWEDRMVTRLVNKRCGLDKTTVLVSNQGRQAFESRVGVRVTDRINDAGGMIICEWPSLRGRIRD